MSEPEPFDHENPDDIVADMFRRQVMELVLDADKVTIYREMGNHEKLQAFIAGALTGLVGAAFCFVKPEGYDAVADYIRESLPHARTQAENVRGPNGETLANHHDATLSQQHGQEGE